MNKKELEPRNIYFFLNSIAAAVEYTSKTDPFRWMKGGKKRIQNGVQNGVQNGKEGLEDFFKKKPEKGVGKWKAEKPKTFWNFFPFFSFFFWKKKITFRCCWQMTRRARSRTFRLGLWRVAPRFTEFYRVFFLRDQRWPFPIFGRSSRRVSMDRERVYRVLRELP